MTRKYVRKKPLKVQGTKFTDRFSVTTTADMHLRILRYMTEHDIEKTVACRRAFDDFFPPTDSGTAETVPG